ncbi:MAG: hypothetical protein HYW49_10825 [Deltaproteobacteria bacterium]|nr:hypothetical protein [Deltaproteobacteria bacterium]
MSSGTDREKKKPGFEGTRVDLGEDLLVAGPAAGFAGAAPPGASPVEEELRRGRALIGENFLEDAKKLLRRILIRVPGQVEARALLDEIQAREMRDLLGHVDSTGSAANTGVESGEIAGIDPREVLEKLDADLQLGIAKSDGRVVPDLFADEGVHEAYRKRVVAAALALPPRERIDLGVANLEMGLHETAAQVFETVARYADYRIEGAYLLGLALIAGGKAIEATLKLEPLVRDFNLAESEKTDLLYLMGMAFEALRDPKRAREFYRRVYRLNPKYRDVADKVR